MIHSSSLRSALLPSILVAVLAPVGLMAACESEGSDTITPTGTAANGATGGTTGTGGSGLTTTNGGTGGTATGTGGLGAGGTTGTGLTGGQPPCVNATCAGKEWACGNCLDDDNDGLIDAYDPDCLGPCDNNESGFSLEIPGGGSTNKCFRDCYYDDNSGAGNDDCYWDLYCDPLQPQIELGCDYDPTKGDCAETQSQTCLDICLPLVPNGCDCFGCCELPAESGHFVYIGSENDGIGPTCTLEVMADEALCHECIPVEDCVNTCGHCELCLGKTEIPADCFGDPDGGLPDGSVPDGGFPDGGTPQCPEGNQPCGLPGQDACLPGYYCFTGCCRAVPT